MNYRKLPRLYLAPMEGLGDLFFRKAISKVAAFDEASTEFIRVPTNAHIPSLVKKYHADEISPHILAAQVMGQDKELVAEMTDALISRGAPRVDLNCGCPSNIVVGRGAGSSLLKEPSAIFEITEAMVKIAKGRVPITVKMRSGYADTSNLKENIEAINAAGASFLTIHHRTKVEGYTQGTHWERIRFAKECSKIPVVGSGDINCASDAKKMLEETGCDGLMVGRAAVRNPLIFHEIKALLSSSPYEREWDKIALYFQVFFDEMLKADLRSKTIINKLKQLIANYFIDFPEHLERKKHLLTQRPENHHSFFQNFLEISKNLESFHRKCDLRN